MSGRRGRGGGAGIAGGRGSRTVVIGGGPGAGRDGRSAGGPPKTLNERFSALSAPAAKRKAQANQRTADARFAQARTLRSKPPRQLRAACAAHASCSSIARLPAVHMRQNARCAGRSGRN